MGANFRKVLIIDDSELDREVLKSILCEEYELFEADNGYAGLEIIIEHREDLDAILLDVSMPVLDGFSVLQLMRKNKVTGIPVFLITAEATAENVKKAMEFHISGLIKKPFDQDDVLRRMRGKLGVAIGEMQMDETTVTETRRYIARYKELYTRYLTAYGRDVKHYQNMVELMKLMLRRYRDPKTKKPLDAVTMEVVSEAAFFCDIGFMLMQVDYKTASYKDLCGEKFQMHTENGADLMMATQSGSSQFFSRLCMDYCMHHHERNDGNGVPNRTLGRHDGVFVQICRLAEEFDHLFARSSEYTSAQYELAMGDIAKSAGFVSPKVFALLAENKSDILRFYRTEHKAE